MGNNRTRNKRTGNDNGTSASNNLERGRAYAPPQQWQQQHQCQLRQREWQKRQQQMGGRMTHERGGKQHTNKGREMRTRVGRCEWGRGDANKGGEWQITSGPPLHSLIPLSPPPLALYPPSLHILVNYFVINYITL